MSEFRRHVGVDPGEVALAGDHGDDGADGAEVPVSARLALGGLEEAVDRLEEAVGPAGVDPGEDAVK